jgi:hypothetical protein
VSLKGDAWIAWRTLKSNETEESIAPVHRSFATTLRNTARLLNKVRRDSILSGINGACATDLRKGTSPGAQRKYR